MTERPYAEDRSAAQTWLDLAGDPRAVLVDVRSRAEWAFVGVPDLSALGREPVMVEWQMSPDMRANPDFVDEVARALDAQGAGRDTSVYFLCRSGGRSAAAAAAMTAAGWTGCHNVSDGFEGRLDAARHRGTVEGWKASGLPWIQS